MKRWSGDAAEEAQRELKVAWNREFRGLWVVNALISHGFEFFGVVRRGLSSMWGLAAGCAQHGPSEEAAAHRLVSLGEAKSCIA